MQATTDNTGITCMQFVAQVNNLDRWQDRTNASRQLDETIVITFSSIIRFYRGGGTPKHNGNTQNTGQDDGGLACMVGWSALRLFVGWLVFLIDNNQTGIWQGRKECGTRANYHINQTCPNTPPFIVAF